MAKGKDFRGGLNSLLKKTEPVKKKPVVTKITKPVEEKVTPKKPRKTVPLVAKKVVTKKPVEKVVKTTKKEIVKEEPVVNYETKRKRGRPKTNHKVITKSSQIGTKEGETRATFIVKEEYLEKFKALAYWERKSIKKIVNAAMQQYLEGQDDKTIARAMKSFSEK